MQGTHFEQQIKSELDIVSNLCQRADKYFLHIMQLILCGFFAVGLEKMRMAVNGIMHEAEADAEAEADVANTICADYIVQEAIDAESQFAAYCICAPFLRAQHEMEKTHGYELSWNAEMFHLRLTKKKNNN